MTRRRSHRWLAVPLLFAAAPLAAQEHRRAHDTPDSQKFRVTAPSGVPEIPFRMVNNHILIPIAVNGSEPFQMILDTGMPMPGLALYDGDRVAALGLEIDPGLKARVGGAGGRGKRFEAKIASGVSWSAPGLETTGSTVTIMPAMPNFAQHHEGIVGAALFRNFAVEIDYDGQVIRLHDPDGYEPPPGSTPVPLALEMGIPFVEATAKMADGSAVKVTLPVDLGASHAVSLHTDSDDRIVVPEGAIETVVGRGLSGPLRGSVGRLPALLLGGFELKNVVATFPVSEHQGPRGMDSRNGNLGNGVLQRFHVTFDYRRGRMLLAPNRRFGEPFEFDMSGLVFEQDSERGVYVESVLPDSPAAEAGLRPDDVILSVNGRKAGEAGSFSLREMLRREGERVTIRYRRGKKEGEVTFALRRLV